MTDKLREPKRRAIPPMPVAPIYDHKDTISLTSAGYGVLMRIAHYWWISGCKPLPKPGECAQIGRAHPRIWATEKAVIYGILDDAMPVLQNYYEQRQKKRSLILEIGRDAHFRASAKRRAESATLAQQTRDSLMTPQFNPNIPEKPKVEIDPNRPKRAQR